MLDITAFLPPIIRGTSPAPGDATTAWVAVVVVVALVLMASIVIVIAAYRTTHPKPQAKEAERYYEEVFPQLEGKEKQEVRVPEAEEKMPLLM